MRGDVCVFVCLCVGQSCECGQWCVHFLSTCMFNSASMYMYIKVSHTCTCSNDDVMTAY